MLGLIPSIPSMLATLKSLYAKLRLAQTSCLSFPGRFYNAHGGEMVALGMFLPKSAACTLIVASCRV